MRSKMGWEGTVGRLEKTRFGRLYVACLYRDTKRGAYPASDARHNSCLPSQTFPSVSRASAALELLLALGCACWADGVPIHLPSCDTHLEVKDCGSWRSL